MRSSSALLAGLALTVAVAPALAGTIDVDFDSAADGDIATTQFTGVTIAADNPNRTFDLAVIFDSGVPTSETTDNDLLYGSDWAGGNLQGVSGNDLENLLIIQENDDGYSGSGDTNVSDPDDEGQRPAGSLSFDFGNQYLSAFGLSIVDIEAQTLEGSSLEFFDGLTSLAEIQFSTFEDGGAYDNDAVWGDRFANRISPLTTTTLGIASFNRVVVHLGGSGAIGDITATMVPLPPAAWMGLGLLGMLGIARRRRRRAL